MKKNKFKKNMPYHYVSEFYDKMMMHVEYPIWANYIYTIISKHDLPHSPILEVGCGTGIFAQQFALDTMGLDFNLPMLQQYRHKDITIPLICDSLPHLGSISSCSFSGILMLYDTINYLQKPAQWHEFFRRAVEILKPEGWMIFDIVTPFCCQTYFQNNQYEEKYKDGRFIRKTKFNIAKNIQHNYFYIYKETGEFYEHHRQYVPPVSWIMDILADHPFEILAVYDDMTTDKVTSDSLRVHFVLQKRK